jgi:hypothetical protein
MIFTPLTRANYISSLLFHYQAPSADSLIFIEDIEENSSGFFGIL